MKVKRKIRTVTSLYATAKKLIELGPMCRDLTREKLLNGSLDADAYLNAIGAKTIEEAVYMMTFDQMAINVSTAWVKSGCQLFKLDERTLDLAIATTPLSLRDFHETDDDGLSVWRLPYNVFALELPFSIDLTPGPNTTLGDVKGSGNLCIVEPFFEDGVFGWVVVYEDENFESPNGQHDGFNVSMLTEEERGPLFEVITNLSFFLNETGTLSKINPSYGGFTKKSKEASRSVQAWSASFHQVTNIPLGIAKEFLQTGKKAGEQVRMGRRIMVRGHWRLQPHGPGRRFRKHKWIAPYMKGDDADPLWKRTYKVTPGKIESLLDLGEADEQV